MLCLKAGESSHGTCQEILSCVHFCMNECRCNHESFRLKHSSDFHERLLRFRQDMKGIGNNDKIKALIAERKIHGVSRYELQLFGIPAFFRLLDHLRRIIKSIHVFRHIRDFLCYQSRSGTHFQYLFSVSLLFDQ